jgi:ADP-heptose:LPS heptosyltransferase
VLFPGALGDFICFLPALGVLSASAPVDLFARSEFAELVPPHVRVRSLECFEVRRLFAPGAAAEERLWSFFGAYQSVYSWMGSRQSEFVNQLKCVSRGRERVFPFRPDPGQLHQADYYLSCIGKAHERPRVPALSLRTADIDWSRKYWAQHSLNGKTVLTLAPGSGAKEKNWPVVFYLDVAEWWARRTQGAVITLVGPVEEERGGFDLLRHRSILTKQLTLSQVAALLARSDLYLGNDSGISHLAAALGVRTVTLFGPSDARQWAPCGDKVTILCQGTDCSPCQISAMKSCPHRKCLNEFYPSEIIKKLETFPELATLTRERAGIRV